MNSSARRGSPTTSRASFSAACSDPLTLLTTLHSLSRPGVSHNSNVTSRELANSICETLRRNGHQALLVGGCVRDLLLGRQPADYDVATDASPERVIELFPESVPVGAQFSVVYSRTAQEDVKRRDFTVNGLLMRHDTEEVLDYVGGQADLKAGIIRAIGDPALRFAEDKLRMMRAVRFAARFGFHIETATFEAIRSRAQEIRHVSAERLREELTKLLTEGAARRGFELLDEAGLLQQVLPEIAAMKGVEQPPQFHPEGDVWIHTRMMIEMLPAGSSPTLAWGILLHDVGKPPTFKSAAETGDRIRFNGHVE